MKISAFVLMVAVATGFLLGGRADSSGLKSGLSSKLL